MLSSCCQSTTIWDCIVLTSNRAIPSWRRTELSLATDSSAGPSVVGKGVPPFAEVDFVKCQDTVDWNEQQGDMPAVAWGLRYTRQGKADSRQAMSCTC
jgi:hypothetical protein